MIEELQGEVLTHIDVASDQVLLTTESGRQIRIFHAQDCCESVSIEETEGVWASLLGKELIFVHQNLEHGSGDYGDTWTRTALIFTVNDATVINHWYESVDFQDLTLDLLKQQYPEFSEDWGVLKDYLLDAGDPRAKYL